MDFGDFSHKVFFWPGCLCWFLFALYTDSKLDENSPRNQPKMQQLFGSGRIVGQLLSAAIDKIHAVPYFP